MNEELSELLLKYKHNTQSIADVDFKTQLEAMGDIKDLTRFMKMVNVINTFRNNVDIATDIIKILFKRLEEYELKPPCDECGFEGGTFYSQGLENFNKNSI